MAEACCSGTVHVDVLMSAVLKIGFCGTGEENPRNKFGSSGQIDASSQATSCASLARRAVRQ